MTPRRVLLTIALTLAFAVGLLAAMVVLRPAHTPPILDHDGGTVEGSIATIEPIELNGSTQWLIIRGRDRTNPVLLFLHGGPGTPETAWLNHYNRALEDDFVVVAWEQRGAGKSYRPRPPAATMTMEQFIDDTHALTRTLQERFDQERIFLVGHSWGTLLGIRTAHRHPDDYHALVSIAQVSHGQRENAAIHAWITDQARHDNNRRALRQLEVLGDPADGAPPLEDLSVRLKWVNRYGGGVLREGGMRELAWIMARSPVYTLGEKLRYFRAESFTLAHLYDEVATVDLFTEIPAIDIPLYFIHGRHDRQVPFEVAHDYYLHLRAPHKQMIVFDDAAHSPLFEDPDRFHQIMRDIKTSTHRRQPPGLPGRDR